MVISYGVIGNGENHIASDVTALIAHTKNVIYMEDGDIAVITKDSAELFDKNGEKVIRKQSVVDWSVDAAEKGGYDHFMMKEIKEQPTVIANTVEPSIKDGKVFFDGLNLTDDLLKRINRIVITACGSKSLTCSFKEIFCATLKKIGQTQ